MHSVFINLSYRWHQREYHVILLCTVVCQNFFLTETKLVRLRSILSLFPQAELCSVTLISASTSFDKTMSDLVADMGFIYSVAYKWLFMPQFLLWLWHKNQYFCYVTILTHSCLVFCCFCPYWPLFHFHLTVYYFYSKLCL